MNPMVPGLTGSKMSSSEEVGCQLQLEFRNLQQEMKRLRTYKNSNLTKILKYLNYK